MFVIKFKRVIGLIPTQMVCFRAKWRIKATSMFFSIHCENGNIYSFNGVGNILHVNTICVYFTDSQK